MAKKATTEKKPRSSAKKTTDEKKTTATGEKKKSAREAITFDTGANKYYWNGEKFALPEFDFAERDTSAQMKKAEAWLEANNWIKEVKPRLEKIS